MAAVSGQVAARPALAVSARTPASAALLAPIVTGLVLWAASLSHVDVSHLGQYGLPPALPPLWFAGYGLIVLGTVLTIWLPRRPRGWLIAAGVLAVAVVIYGTIPAIAAEPQYSWVYKHIGVVRFIELHGHVRLGVDIYNRWPGFFALAAVFSELSGLRNPVAYAGLAELFYALVATLLVAAIARSETRDIRVTGSATLIFLFGNWVGQTYFSPQATAYALGLTLILVLTRTLGRGELHDRLVRLVSAVVRKRQLSDLQVSMLREPALGWSRRAALTVIFGLDFAIAATHQLTPYVLIMQVGVMTILGLVTVRTVLIGMVVITIGYLLPNLGFINQNYGLFTSLNPLANAQHSAQYDMAPVAGKTFSAQMSQLLTYMLWLGGAAGAVVLARKGLGRRATTIAVLAFTPFITIFANSYGGEATLRVILFSAPGCAILFSWAAATLRRRWARVVAGGLMAAAMSAVFIPAYFGQTELTIIPRGEVQASEYFYAHAPAGSVLMLSGPDFPIRAGATYDEFRGPKGDDDPNLLADNTMRYQPLGARNVPEVIRFIHRFSTHGFLVFSATEYLNASVFQLTPPGQMADLERAIRRSPRFRLWYSDSDTRIYRLVEGAR
jgi:hypothetical protein